MNKKIVIIGLIVALGLISFYFLINKDGKYSGEPEAVKVRLSWVNQAQFAGFYVAEQKGFYRDAGLMVDLLELDDEIDQVVELNQEEVDFSVMEGHQFLAGIESDLDAKALMAIYQINPHALAARADSGIDGPEDFTGKVIGLSGGEGEGDSLFRIFIEKFGGIENLEFKKLGFDSVDDFTNNNADIIDLYSIDQPYLAKQRGIDLNIISLDTYGLSTYGDVLVANNDLIEANPDLIKRFVQATIRGWQYALSNQEEAVDIVLGYTTGDYKDKDYQSHILQQSVPLVRGSQDDLGRMELVSWSTLYESMKAAGVMIKDLDIKDLYTNEFIY